MTDRMHTAVRRIIEAAEALADAAEDKAADSCLCTECGCSSDFVGPVRALRGALLDYESAERIRLEEEANARLLLEQLAHGPVREREPWMDAELEGMPIVGAGGEIMGHAVPPVVGHTSDGRAVYGMIGPGGPKVRA